MNNSSDGSDNNEFCGKWWAEFWTHYNFVDSYVTLVVCAVGLVTNVFNIAVFTRPHMWTPTNSILAALALSDFLGSLRVVAGRGVILFSESHGEWRNPGQVAVEELIDWIAINLFHVWSVYLTLTMAIWRFLAVVHPLRNRRWCTWRATTLSMVAVVIWSFIIVPPMFVTMTVITTNKTDGSPFYKYDYEPDAVGWDVFLWIHGLLIKVIPSMAMTVLCIGMIISLSKAKTVRRQMTQFVKKKGIGVAGQVDHRRQKELEREQEFNRTTRMLLVMLIIFLLTEFPYGILSLVDTIIASDAFYRECDQPMENFLNLNEFISSSSSFFVYVGMNRKFRKTLLGFGEATGHYFTKSIRIATSLYTSSTMLSNNLGTHEHDSKNGVELNKVQIKETSETSGHMKEDVKS